MTALAPLARLAAATSGTGLARVSAFVYGMRHAAELRATASEARRAVGGSSRVSRRGGQGLRGQSPGKAEREVVPPGQRCRRGTPGVRS